MRIITFLLLCLASFADIDKSIHNGETFIIPIHQNFTTDCRPFTTINSLLIIPIPYHKQKGSCHITIDGRKIALHITPKRYPKEQLYVAKSKVHPPKSLFRRIRNEFAQAQSIYHTTTPRSYLQGSLTLPLHSAITSPFGVARLFNNHLKSYHSGVDFKAPVRTPVRSINQGVVVLAKRRYYAGGSIIIDHGRGIYSCYYHLSKFLVKPGARVKRGEIIALSGKSGRVTGAHLHLTIKIKGVSVDPIQFIASYNQALAKTGSSPRSGSKR